MPKNTAPLTTDVPPPTHLTLVDPPSVEPTPAPPPTWAEAAHRFADATRRVGDLKDQEAAIVRDLRRLETERDDTKDALRRAEEALTHATAALGRASLRYAETTH